MLTDSYSPHTDAPPRADAPDDGRATDRIAGPVERPVGAARRGPWWRSALWLAGALTVAVTAIVVLPAPVVGTPGWWIATLLLHAPFAAILLFLAAGSIERLGFLAIGRSHRPRGRLPEDAPLVCVQVPLFNEPAVAARVIAAVGALRWPAARPEIQILDDSTEQTAREIVDVAAADLRRRSGAQVSVRRRDARTGYKAGALEAGRRATSAEFITIFDADFLPTPDFLDRTIPHFFRADGSADEGLALVQAQWGHLNADQSPLTRSQSLWVDDHHTVQMSWRSAAWGFVNFTGTAGVWRASAIERAGGWRAASLVEDCELSFRHLFAGYRTTFVRDVIAPAELPTTVTAYKAQQKRWTQGWAQVQRLHLRTLAREYETSAARRLHLLYHMCIPWQWPLWALWITLMPALIHSGLWFGAFGTAAGLGVYLVPMTLWLAMATVIASAATPELYPDRLRRFGARIARIAPYVVINTGMLPHQLCAFLEGLTGPLHTEFERTPKSAAVAGSKPLPPAQRAKRSSVRIHWPYVSAEAAFVAFQLTWAIVFAAQGQVWPALGAAFLAGCVLTLGAFYGDHAGRMFFVIDTRRR